MILLKWCVSACAGNMFQSRGEELPEGEALVSAEKGTWNYYHFYIPEITLVFNKIIKEWTLSYSNKVENRVV